MELIGASAVIAMPERLTRVSVAALAADLDAALAAPARVVTFTGTADGTFCLGLALDAPDDGEPATALFADLLLALHRAPKPLLALVDGRAIGGGLGIACACDRVIASERSTFALPELLWGLIPAIIWPVIADRMAPHAARQWTISAHARNAADAAAAGLADEVTPVDGIPEATKRAERALARLEPAALVRFRDWARRSRSLPLAEALAAGAGITSETLRGSAARERWNAFTAGDQPW